MANSTWTIFPPVASSQLIDVLSAASICDVSNKHINKLLNRQLLSQTIQIVGQDEQLLETIRKFVIDSCELGFLLLRNMPLYILICPQFIDAFCRKGSLYGVSINRDANFDDTVALSNAQILLSLNSMTYNKLGIIGKKSTLNSKKNLLEKYRVLIELTKDCFKPEKKNYQRVYECLKRSQMKCDFIIKWNPHEANISSNSLEQFFRHVIDNSHDDKLLSKMTLHKCYPTLRTYVNYSTLISFPNNNITNECEEDVLKEFIEWISAQIAEVKNENAFRTFDEAQTPLGDIYCAEIKGFFASSDVIKLLNTLKSCFTTNKEQAGAIVVHGFEDSPQCWTGRNNEHYKDVSGDNIVGIGQLDQKVISWAITDQFDFGIEKL